MTYGCAQSRLPADVTIDGLALGGTSMTEATERLRGQMEERLSAFTVHTPKGDYTFERGEIGYLDDVQSLLPKVRRGGTYKTVVRYYLKGLDGVAERICMDNNTLPVDATVEFTPSGFVYTADREGLYCDPSALKAEIRSALGEGKSEVSLQPVLRTADVTESALRERTALLASFSTSFFSSENRIHNIRLACERIDGTVLLPGGEFSFNGTVGKRTAENGFREATVIQDGVYQTGVGGGVCQVSTTLYNAALRAGLGIVEANPHSLCVGYVSPSMDAMVSSRSDMRFVNSRGAPVYVRCCVRENRIVAELYGLSDGNRYEPESVVRRRIPPPAPEIRYGMTEETLREAHTGAESEGYLNVYDAQGRRIERRLLRRDRYDWVQGIVQKVPQID